MFSKFLTEKELARYNEISEAIEVLETKNFTPEQLRGYELYIDNMRSYVTNMAEARKEGLKEGIEQGIEKGKEELINQTLLILQDIKEQELTITQIAEKYQMELSYIHALAERG